MKSEWTFKTVIKYFERVIEELDKRYDQRLQLNQVAVSTALSAQEKSVAAAFEASEKAIIKAEIAQTAYNLRSNEFRAALDDQSKTFIPRIEADGRFQQLRDLVDSQLKQIIELQKSESRGEGGVNASNRAKSQSQWTIGTIITITLATISGISGWVLFLLGKTH